MPQKSSLNPKPTEWSIRAAKARLSEVLADAQVRPQIIKNRSKPVAVLVGYDEFMRMRGICAKQTLGDLFGEVRSILVAEEADLFVPERRVRSVPELDD